MMKNDLFVRSGLAAVLIATLGQSVSAQSQPAKMQQYVSQLMGRMTVAEKIGQLNLVTAGYGITGATVSEAVDAKIKAGSVGALLGLHGSAQVRRIQEIAVKQSRLHIPLFFGLDVIHGYKTIFPIPLGLSCTWDMGLIEQSARIAATEATADGLNWAFSPMVDIARDPRWGRISEGSGEDPYLGSQVARAMVRGYQGPGLGQPNTLMACVKHFALYGAAEAGRDYNTVDMSRRQMYQYYLPPYQAALDAGAASVMSSFNVVDGVPATANAWLMTDVLRKQWGFKGLVVTDYTAVNELTAHGLGDLAQVSALALKAGIDMDMVGEGFLTTLQESLRQKRITLAEIDQACRRILEAKYRLGLFEDPYRYLDERRAETDILTTENRQAARRIAARSFVLLKNANQTLPLPRKGTVALIGPLADNHADMLGTWVVAGDATKSVSVREGLRNVAGDQVKVLYAKGANFAEDAEFLKRVNFYGQQLVNRDARPPAELLQEAVTTARQADVVVAVLGESQSMSGESSSRADIGLPENQLELLKALVKTGRPVVLVLFNGRPLTLTWEDEHVAAVLETWAGGTEAGNAIADVLFGQYNPAGKLTATFPRSVGQIPLYYNHLPTGRPFSEQGPAKFKSDYLDISNDPLYPFGYGLSYTRFTYSGVQLSKTALKGNETLTATVTLTNAGTLAGEETVQLYVADPVASVSRSVKELKAFRKVLLQPGQHQEVSFQLTPDMLKFYNSQLQYDWEPGEFEIQIGTNSQTVQTAKVNWQK